jgi:hypothetical protein
VRLSGLPELLAKLARSAADFAGTVGGVDKSFGRSGKVHHYARPFAEKAAMTPSGTAQGVTGQHGEAAGGVLEVGAWAWVIEGAHVLGEKTNLELASRTERDTAAGMAAVKSRGSGAA